MVVETVRDLAHRDDLFPHVVLHLSGRLHCGAGIARGDLVRANVDLTAAIRLQGNSAFLFYDRALIKQLVDAEDAVKPLSDSQIAQMLEEQGIQVARRTVAKYREALRIAPANLRRAM